MSLTVDFHPVVRSETDAGYHWYEQRQAGLGTAFLDEVEQVLTLIATNPARYGFADGDIREGLLPRFPYAIYYRVLSDRIRVLAVFHTARNQSIWQSRT